MICLSFLAQWSPEPTLLQQGHDPAALARTGRAFELAHPFLRVPAYKVRSAMRADSYCRFSV